MIAGIVPGVVAESLLLSEELFETIFKLAQRKVHPDLGGAHEKFVRLQEAGAVLVEHFKQRRKAAGE